jgi:hypothetical protein
MRHAWTHPILYVLAALILLSPLAALPALGRPADEAVPVARAASGSRARLTPEQAIRVALNGLVEVGANDFRLSDMGEDVTYDAAGPAVAYNSTDNEYLVVWYGDDDVGALVDGEYEIFAQRVDAATGAEIGPDLRLSDMGPDGDPAYDARGPAVAYNSAENEYLVVWQGDDDTGALVDEEFEIYGQRVEGNTGAEIGPDFRLSDMGFDGSPNYDAFLPAVAYNSAQNEYLVVWYGDDNTPPLVVEEFEIFGQRVAATGAEIGTDFRLSDMGPDGNPNYDAYLPAVACDDSADGQYLVVWYGDDDTAPLVDEEFEVYGQRVDAASGAEVGANDFRLSDMGPDGDPDYDGGYPAVAYDSTDHQYLVVWTGDDDTGALVDEEYEVYGQRVDAASGAEVGANDFRLSDMGPDGDPGYGTQDPAVVYNSAESEYLVVWAGDDNTPPLVDEEFEVFGQRVDAATGAELGVNDFRLSDMGPDGDDQYDATDLAAAYNSADDQYLAVWQGDDNAPPLVDEEYEIYGQRLDGVTGAELGTDHRLSNAGPDGDPAYGVWFPAVAYNSVDNEYLVVWTGDDNAPPLVDEEYEIYGQRVDAATGAEIGPDLRLSDMGPDGDPDYIGAFPAVAYNSAENEYLVAWLGDDNTPPLVEGEVEVFGQRVDGATGLEIGANDFRLSDMGPDGDPGYGVGEGGIAVAYNSTADEYLVVWCGDDNTPPLVDEEHEVFGQRVDGATGAEIGANDFRLSDMGPDGDPDYDARLYPAAAYNSAENEYLVVWCGDDNTPPLVDEELEVFGQRVQANTGAEIGPDVRLSDMGPDGDPDYGALRPMVAYNSVDNEYLVVWTGDDDTPPLVDEELEVFGQRVDGATGLEIGANDFRLSDMGPDGDPAYNVGYAAVAYNGPEDEYLVVWYGDDDTPPLVEGEFEVFGQRVDGATGAELGANDFRLSDMGPDGDPAYGALFQALAYNSADNEYLVVWQGDDNTPPLVEGEFEVFGQRLGGGYRIYLPLVLKGEAP